MFSDKHNAIKVVGIGGAGGNIVEFMLDNGLSGADSIAMNTDEIGLNRSRADIVMRMGSSGKGAGMCPVVGRKLAEESIESIRDVLPDTSLVVALAGLGHGTGTGSSPVVMQASKTLGAFTIAIVTTPFYCEGDECKKNAETGLQKLSNIVDALFVLDNAKVEAAFDDGSMVEWLRIIDSALGAVTTSIIDIASTSNISSTYVSNIANIFGRHEIQAAASVCVSGNDRAINAVAHILESPLFKGIDEQDTDMLLVGIESSSALPEQEIDLVIEKLRDKAGTMLPVHLGVRHVTNMRDAVRISSVALRNIDKVVFPSEFAARAA